MMSLPTSLLGVAQTALTEPLCAPTVERSPRLKTLKHCPSCDQDLPITDFNRRSAAQDGLQSYCRACASERGRVHKAQRHARAAAHRASKAAA